MGFDYIKNETSAIYIKKDKAKLYEKWKLVKDDLIITTVGSKPPVYDSLVGRTIVVKLKDEGSLLNQNAVCLRANNNIEQLFLNNLFRRQEYISFIESIIRGNANQGSIALVDLFKYIILQPKSKEQQKIANCLSSIDTLITAQTKKLNTLNAHKRGLMQQLFPATGETVPKLRFPEFQDTGNWEQKPLKKVFSIFQGFAFSSNDSINNGTRWLKIADVSIQKMNHSTPSYLPARYKDKYKKFLVKQGDYVIALTRPILSKQLKIASVDKVFHNALLNQRVGKVVTTQNISFVYFLLQTSQLICNIETGISGSEPPNLSAKQIENITTLIPPAIEQQKIANCLSSLDELITTQAKKIESLKAHKKGLMQQLFPATDEDCRGTKAEVVV